MATSTTLVSIPEGSYGVPTPFVSADIGLQAQLPLGPLAPYVGAAVGAYHRSGTEYFSSEKGLSTIATGGARLRFAREYFAQGEMRYRHDQYSFGRTVNAQYAFGLGVRF